MNPILQGFMMGVAASSKSPVEDSPAQKLAKQEAAKQLAQMPWPRAFAERNAGLIAALGYNVTFQGYRLTLSRGAPMRHAHLFSPNEAALFLNDSYGVRTKWEQDHGLSPVGFTTPPGASLPAPAPAHPDVVVHDDPVYDYGED